jgi:dolichyl-phosphate beta-glucosyltransferase
MDLSIIIPVLNESKKVKTDIRATAQFLSENKIEGEIIVVDDGSSDGTADVAKNVEVSSDVILQVLNQKNHRGKGFAVKTGVVKSIGKFVLFVDSGLCVSLDHILVGLKLLQEKKCDIAHGSRFLKKSNIIRPHLRSRRISSVMFRRLFKTLLNIPSELTDTQCGFKIYKGDVARELYADCFTDGFMFDIEIILRAKKNNLRIKEFPIEWKADLDSRLSQVRMPIRMLSELIKIKQAVSNE